MKKILPGLYVLVILAVFCIFGCGGTYGNLKKFEFSGIQKDTVKLGAIQNVA
jgi:hypothetical protein